MGYGAEVPLEELSTGWDVKRFERVRKELEIRIF